MGTVDDHLHLFLLHMLDQTNQVIGRRFDARLELDATDLLKPEPIGEVGPILMVGHNLDPLSGAAMLCQRTIALSNSVR